MVPHAQTPLSSATHAQISYWHAIFAANPECIQLINAQGQLLEMNAAGLTLIEADSLAQVQGQSACSLITEPYRQPFQELTERVWQGESQQLEFEIISLKGTPRYVEMRAVPLRDEAQNVIALLGTTRDITTQKQLELELRAVQEYHLQIFSQNAHPMWFYDPATLGFLDVNEAALSAYGYSRAEFLTLTVRDIRPPEELPRLLLSLDLDAANRLVPRHHRHRKKDGTIIDVDVSSHDLTHAGQPARLVVARDITAQKQADQLLRKSEEQLQSILGELDNIVWSMSGDARQVLYLNPATARVYGRPVSDFYEHPDLWRDTVYPPDRPLVEATFVSLLQTGSADVEYRIVRPDGELRWLHTRTQLILDDHQCLVRIDGLGTDITERKQVEGRLLEQAMLLNQVREAILLLDLQGRVLFWNPGAERLYGWSAADVLGQSLEEKIFRRSPHYDQAVRELLQHGSWKGELPQFTQDGTEIIVQGYWTIVYDDNQVPKSILGVNHDITEKKALEAKFLRAQRLESVGALASGIAHDLNNVLSPMAISVFLLRTRLQEQKETELLDTMDDLIERGANMVKQVLSFVRGSAGEPVILNPKHVLREIVGILKEALPRSITLQYGAATQLHSTFGDPTQLHQAVMNLCVNARDAMPAGGTLTISAENCVVDEFHAEMIPEVRPGQYVQIMVADTGEGIAPQIRAKIFTPFFTTKDIEHGTGLGLSTVQSIVQKSGGFITLYSEVGQGTQFRIYLPVYASEQLAEAVIAPAPLPRGNGELILVVDDEIALRNLIQRTLEAFGYQVLTVSNGKDASALYANHNVQAVLIDMMMPVMDGPTTIRALQGLKPALPCIASSALSVSAKLDEAKQLGVQQVLLKPYTAEMLLRTVANVLNEEGA